MAVKVATSKGCIRALREVTIMHRLGLLDSESPFCVAVESALMVKARMHIVMQWAEYGTLFSLLDRQTSQLPEATCKVLTWSLLSALSFCHARGIAHLDVKAENALLIKRGEEHAAAAAASGFAFPADAGPYVAVLCDFGEAAELSLKQHPEDDERASADMPGVPAVPLASSASDTSAHSRQTSAQSTAHSVAEAPAFAYDAYDEPCHSHLAGSLDYVAPDVLRKSYRPREADMWSMGVTLFLMLSNQLPFMAATQELTEHRILNQREPLPRSVFPRVSEAAASLLLHLLRRDAAQRLSADDALRHPWISGKGGDAPWAAAMAAIPTGLDVPFTHETSEETEV